MSTRTDKVASVVNRVVSAELRRLIPNTFLSITEVRVSADIKHATIWLSSIGIEELEPATLKEQLVEHIPQLQRALAKQMQSKFTPKLTIKLDQGAKHAESIKKMPPLV